jgi:hypothetical protein
MIFKNAPLQKPISLHLIYLCTPMASEAPLNWVTAQTAPQGRDQNGYYGRIIIDPNGA